jgi:hypothetical protein
MPVIPAIQEADIGRIAIWGQPRQKVSKIPSQLINWAWWYMPVVPAMLEGWIEELRSRLTLGKNPKNPKILKNPKAKKAEGVAQVVEHFL